MARGVLEERQAHLRAELSQMLEIAEYGGRACGVLDAAESGIAVHGIARRRRNDAHLVPRGIHFVGDDEGEAR